MAKNISLTSLDTPQAFKRTIDDAHDAVRIVHAHDNTTAIQIEASDGDNILVVGTSDGTLAGAQSVAKVVSGALTTALNSVANSAAVTSANTGIVLGPISAVGLTSFAIYCNTTTNIVGGQQLTLQVSPDDTANVWVSTTVTVTPNATAGNVVVSSVGSVCARRVQVITAGAITSGGFEVYLVGQSS